MDVIFRVDASLEMGSGHVMRCLTLAHVLKQHGANCRFIMRLHIGNMQSYIQSQGFAVIALEFATDFAQQSEASEAKNLTHAAWLGADQHLDALQTSAMLKGQRVDWLVVDHYAIDSTWEKLMRHSCKRLMVIDDLADRPHECDILLDQNLGRQQHDYSTLVPCACKLLMGTQYALLRPEFERQRAHSLQRRRQPNCERILISMGGVDQANATGRVLQALKTCALPKATHITVIMGSQAPWLDPIRCLAQTMPWITQIVVGVNDMALRMSESDLAIGAAGSTAWERCCLGLPTLTFITAENQRPGALALQAQAAILLVGDIYSEIHLDTAIDQILSSGTLARMGLAASSLVDGLGTTHVIQAMLNTYA